ncbi:class I SAM-dependent methyltransferase, partial [candidate division WOR-3 bacterium]|nr:class I SAM-dependent methyltransferase [candidate division WOR-3 bacterium]
MGDCGDWFNGEGERFLQAIGVKSGNIVVDFGCGSGCYAIPAAKLVGATGTVYAVDENDDMLEKLKSRIMMYGVRNVVTIHGDETSLRVIGDDAVDVILAYDVLHFMDKVRRGRLYQEFHRILKPEGLLSVYPKHNRDDSPMWELQELSVEDVIEEIEANGFKLVAKYRERLIHDETYE